jgi:hypothetical protein
VTTPEGDPPERIRFGYVQFTGADTYTWLVLPRDAPADVLTEMDEVTAALFEVKPIAIAMDILERSYRELAAAVEEHNAILGAADNNVISMNILEGFIEISRCMIAFLASATAFLGACENMLMREFGKASFKSSAWVKKKNELHAAHFAYRFMYALRNYCQHANLPISDLNSSGTVVGEGGSMLFTSGVRVNRDKLFADHFDWPSKLIQEIRSQAEQFDLMPLSETYVNCMRRLFLEMITTRAGRLEEMGRYLMTVMRHLQVPDGAVPALFFGENAAPGYPPAKMAFFPVQQFLWLEALVHNLRRDCAVP